MRTDSAASLGSVLDVVDAHTRCYQPVPDLHEVPAQVVDLPRGQVGGPGASARIFYKLGRSMF